MSAGKSGAHEDCWTPTIATHPNLEIRRHMYEFYCRITQDSIWVIVDRLTKTSHFLPVKVQYTMVTYAKVYIARVLILHGVPRIIVSHRGPQFVSKFWEELHKSLGTKLLYSLAYHPHTSGQTKRVNSGLAIWIWLSCTTVEGKGWAGRAHPRTPPGPKTGFCVSFSFLLSIHFLFPLLRI
jgi:hypothetical protein